MILTRKILEDLIGRLEHRLDQLDERISARLSVHDDRGRRTEEQLAELREKQGENFAESVAFQQRTATQIVAEFHRLEALVREAKNDSAAQLAIAAEQFAAIGKRLESTVAIVVQQNREFGNTLSQLSESIRRLDSDVAAQLSNVGKRLDADLVLLADRSHQLSAAITEGFQTTAKTTHELVESNRYAAGTLSKLAADQIRTAGVSRQDGSTNRTQPVAEAAPLIVPPIKLLTNTKLPAAVHKWLTRQGIAPSELAWCLDQKQLPQTSDTLPRLLEIMAACRQRLQPGEHLIWARRAEQEPPLAPAEIQQLLGLIGPTQGPADVEDEGGKWRVAVAERRIEAVGVILRWSIPGLEELHVRLRPLAEEMLDRLKVRDAAHGVDLPESNADMENWARLLPSLVTIVPGNAPIGISLPSDFDKALERMDEAVTRLRQALRDGNKKDEIAFQWVRGSVSIGKSSTVLAFARQHGIGFDLTPVNRGAPESRLAAYDDRLPYRALPFDLRLPSYAKLKDTVVEIPRWPGRAVDTRSANGESTALGTLLDEEFERNQRRLDRVLDRARQKQFELQVNLDPTQMDYWPQYFVHNWSPPATAWLRLFEFDVVELFSKASPLLRVYPGERAESSSTRVLNGSQFLTTAAKYAIEAPTAKALLQYQIEAHSYLRNRLEITADAERLISWMPESLGITLELGSGFGVMARRLKQRARRYIGFDLTLDQASALRELGGISLVADMQAMPFADSVFDTILADNVVEHAASPLQVFLECQRVLKPGGSMFMVIPPDYRRPDFCNDAHLWKSDEESVREALRQAGLQVVRQETVHLAELGVGGTYPSSDGQTGLWRVEKGAAAPRSGESKRVGGKAK